MQVFKNQAAISGSVSLRRAFAEELKSLGYSEYVHDDQILNDHYIQVNQYGGQGRFTHASNAIHAGSDDVARFTLPQDWDAALASASIKIEKEEKVEEPPIVVHDYTARFYNDPLRVELGCQTFTYDQVYYLDLALKSGALTTELTSRVLSKLREVERS